MATKKKKLSNATEINLVRLDHTLDVIADLTTKLFNACTALESSLLADSCDDEVELPYDLDPWYRHQLDRRAEQKQELRKQALAKLTDEEREALDL